MTKKIILHLCADTGSDTKPYQDDPDYEVILIGSKIGVENYHPPKNVYGIIANPPCTNFSSVRTSAKIPRNEEEGMRLVKECQRIIEEANPVFWVIENPATGLLKKYLGKPRFVYQPWEFGSPWTKKTALWGEFNAPEKLYNTWEEVPNKMPELYIRPGREKPAMVYLHKSAYKLINEFHSLPQPDSDMELRSLCSQKFAQAFKSCNP
jgi:site-specific DNA-cytosine methylase